MSVVRYWFLTLKSFFYDSYSGLKKRRIVIAGGSTLAAVVLIITILCVIPVTELYEDDSTQSDGQDIPSDSVFPNTLPGHGAYIEPAPNPRDPVVPEEGREWYYDDSRRWGPPMLGDIESTEGNTYDDPDNDNIIESSGGENTEDVIIPDNSLENNPYTYWDDPVSVRAMVKTDVSKLQNNILFVMRSKATEDGWRHVAADASQILMNAPLMGAAVKAYTSETTVAIWNELEAVYLQLYEEVYMCESAYDLQRVCDGTTHQSAMALTTQFIEALDREAVN